jgi:hypothetical protein
MNSQQIQLIAGTCDQKLGLATAVLGSEYYYQSLPFCVIDAVFSVNAKYAGTKRTVTDYCKLLNLQVKRNAGTNTLPSTGNQQSISEFLDIMLTHSPTYNANNIFHNLQRTSTRNGILKAEAAGCFARVLQLHNIQHLQDMASKSNYQALEIDLAKIPGQTQDVSIAYFFMLSGADDFVKVDRRVKNFIFHSIGQHLLTGDIQAGLKDVVRILQPKYPNITCRLLDHEIWKYDRVHCGLPNY